MENSKDFEELRELARPLQDYLQGKYNPYCIVIIHYDRVDVYSGKIGLPTPESVRD